MAALSHELGILVLFYCETYKAVYGVPFFAARKLLQDEAQDATEKEKKDRAALLKQFVGLLEFLHKNNVRVDIHNDAWKGYIKFALGNFAKRSIIVRPASLKSKKLLRDYCLSSRPEQKYNPIEINYARILDPSLRTNEVLALLGLVNVRPD